MSTETPLSLAQAGELVGKHTATVYRWSTVGVRGVVLETLQVGGTRCTSREALQRFCERLTASAVRRRPGPVQVGIGAQRAAEELERHGV